MITPFRRSASLVVFGAVCGFYVAPLANAEEPIFGNGFGSFTPVAAGSYVHRADGSYERLSEVTLGQKQNFSPFDFYTAFAVFDLPTVTGPVTREDMHIPPHEVPDVTEPFRADVTFVTWDISEIGFTQTWFVPLELQVRLAMLPADAVVAGTLDASEAFTGLSDGTLLGSVTLPAPTGMGDPPSASILLSDLFTSAVETSQTGQFVLSFTMPFIDDSRDDLVELLHLLGQQELVVHYDAYRITPVPEPATYGWVAMGLCAALIAWRRVRRSAAGGTLAAHESLTKSPAFCAGLSLRR